MTTIALLGTAYVAVLTAELLGDKMVFTAAALTARSGALPVLAGLVPAQMGKMAAAVLAGQLLARLPMAAIAFVSVVTFTATAVVLWRGRGHGVETTAPPSVRGSRVRAALVAFSAVFFAEWGDVGQLAAAALVTRYGEPWVVWAAATTALVTKGVLAVTLGTTLRHYVPRRELRLGAVAICAAMAIVSAMTVR